MVDSSVIVKWLNQENEDHLDQADRLLQRAVQGDIELLAPELAKYEVGNVLLLGKKIHPEKATVLFDILSMLPVTFISLQPDMAPLSFSLAASLGITYYDAVFLALAQEFGATLVTANTKHQGRANNIKVIAISEFNSQSTS